jgi:predicted phosphohydrolase
MIRFLQISDIHFTDETGNDDGYKLMKCKFLEDIEVCKGLMGKVDRILICGDIAFAGMDNQYKDARSFINRICEKTECEDVLLVPGNHDKKWEVYTRARSIMKDTLLKGKNTQLLLASKVKEPMVVGILYAPFKQYSKLALEYMCISDVALKCTNLPEQDQDIERMPKFKPEDAMYWTKSLGVLNGYPVFIHGGNTSLLSDKDDGDSRKPEIGKHFQVLPLQAYNVAGESNEIHIMMLHHPMSEIIDGAKIEKEIDNRFNLQFYGHVHKQSSSDNGVIKVYSGALQPEEEEDKTEYFPVYNIIEMDVIDEGGKPYLKVDVYSRKWDGAKFDEYEEETKTGLQALKVELKHNDAWERTMKRVKSEKIGAGDQQEARLEVYPIAVKNSFLRSGKERKIIEEMYKDRFDHISPNRVKYLTFLRQVELDGRFNELNVILSRYGK